MTCVWCKGRALNDHDCRNFEHFTEDDMGDRLERTDEAQRGFDGMRTRITAVDGADGLTPEMLRVRQPYQDPMHDGPVVGERNGAAMDPRPLLVRQAVLDSIVDDEVVSAGFVSIGGDPFTDDTPLSCGVENPEECESCT